MYSDTQDCEGSAPAMAASGASIVQLPTRSPLDSTVQTENANGGDWQEELYEKIKSMKEMYFSGLNDLYQKIAYRVQQDPLHQRLSNEQIEKLKIFKLALERILRFLGLNKHDLQLIHKEKLFAVEIHINFFLYPDRLRKPTSSPLQEQLPQSSMQLQQPQSLDGQIDPLMQPVQGSMEAPLDSTSQKGNTNGADWHEEVYHKIKSMKEMYFLKLDDLYQKIVREVQRDPQRLSNEQIEKLNILKMMLERILRFLGLNKHDLQLTHKEKLLSVEKLIHLFLYPLRKPTSPQQEQIPQSSMLLQQPQSLDGQTNLSKQPIQRSMVAMWQNNLTNLQHNSLSGGLTISNSQQLMINTVQPGSSVDLGWGNSVNSLQQMATGSLQQNPFNNRQVYIISQRGMKPVQANLSSLLQNSNVLQQSLPELHEQQLLQNQQLRQQHPHWQMQQQLFQRQQLMRQQQILQNKQLRQQYHHLQMQQQMLQIQQLRRQYHQQQMQQQLLQRQQLRRQQQLFQRQQLRRQQQMLRNQHLRQQYHLQQMQQLLFQRQQSMLLQTSLLPTHQMSQLQQSSIQLQQPQSPDGGN